jgi:ABC-type glucose/galactose transport system permease subunit
MNSLSKFGLAAMIALGMGGAAISQDAGVSVGADVGVDATVTGSINNHGNLVSSIQTTSSFDLGSYSSGDTTVNCIKVSTLQGDAQGNARAVGNAVAGNPAIATLHTDIQGNAELVADVEAACQVAQFDVNDVVFLEMGADGTLIVYYDDSAA